MGNTESIAATGEEHTDTEHAAASQRSHGTRHHQRRRQRRITLETSSPSDADNPWWSKIENESLILDIAPNLTIQVNENESVTAKATLSQDDLAALLKRYENIDVNASEGSVHARLTRSNNAYSTAMASEANEKPTEQSNDETLELDRPAAREQSLEEFKEELRIKRLARQTAVQDLRDEITTLRQQLAEEQAKTRQLLNTDISTPNEGIAIKAENAADANTVVEVPAEVDADDEDPLSRSRHANIELANVQLALQLSQAENLSLRTELGVVQKQVGTLKEVISCCKQMLAVKEEQCTQLKSKLQEIEVSFGEREMKIMSSNLRQEYERQLVNIRQLRQLYEERQRIAAAEQENLQRLISIKRDELQAEQEKTKNYEERNQALVKEVENANIELAALREECNEHKFEKKTLKEEMGAINTLFTQMVMGFNGKNNLDIDRLTAMLEENRTLLNEMTTKEANCSDGATLPKLLFELVEQAAVVDKIKTYSSRSTTPMSEGDADVDVEHDVAEQLGDVNDDDVAADCMLGAADTTAAQQTDTAVVVTNDNEAEQLLGATALMHTDDAAAAVATATGTKNRKQTKRTHGSKSKTMLSFPEAEAMIGKVTSAQEIIGNLPKVWKVLMELLSHHKIEQVQFEENGASEDCYKSVETPNGPKAELSVSKTYIKLKDLILEKKSLMKETNRLKTLNSHLDYRLNEQEKRLSAVSLELTKTWHLVGKMQRQHRQLHTQEQILRYQLQQKRRLLSELKEELEYCRRKWAAARAKNDESQEQCNDLRREFAQRKLDDANHSAESGYSDSGPPSDEEERNSAAVANAMPGCSANATSACSRRKHLKEMFEHTRKIKRMQSTSPGRAAGIQPAVNEEIVVLRWNSAPPTCGWRSIDGADDDDDDDGAVADEQQLTTNRGAIPKAVPHNSRSKQRTRAADVTVAADEDIDTAGNDNVAAIVPTAERATRIQRLEEQCKSLIQKVLETSDNRERLEVQLCRFQDDVAPVQYAVPLDEFINRKRIERMTRASSAPARGTLTPREEEYTRKRSERLERLEEESRQLMSRIKRTTDRGHYLRCSLDRIRRATPRDDSCDSNTEDESPARASNTSAEQPATSVAAEPAGAISQLAADEEAFAARRAARLERLEANSSLLEMRQGPAALSDIGVAVPPADKSPLTEEEEAYTARRAARLKRLEAEGRNLLQTLTHQTQRGGTLEHKLDNMHERYGPSGAPPTAAQHTETIEKRLETIEQISQNRAERLRALEAEGKALLSRLTNTSERGTQMINRIAEREQNRRRSNSTTPKREDIELQEQDAAATALLPTPNNVASTSIVDDMLSDALVVTTTATQIAAQQGAIPKTNKPATELSVFARAKAAKQKEPKHENKQGETLEDMVKRLQQLPFPSSSGIQAASEANSKDDTEPNSAMETTDVPENNAEARASAEED